MIYRSKMVYSPASVGGFLTKGDCPVQQSFLPEIDRERTQAAVEAAFDKYRENKFLTFEEREAATTAAWSTTPRSDTGTTSDQTANIAIHNVDSLAARKEYWERIERIVNRLPRMESFLIKERYIITEYDYITDQKIQAKLPDDTPPKACKGNNEIESS